MNQSADIVPVPAASEASGEETGIKLCNLPPFPAVATRLLHASGREDVDFRDIASILTSDPALGAEFLRVANSPLFVFQTEIHSLDHAITLLGWKRIRDLALAITFRSYGAALSQPVHHQCWAHAIACGVIAEELAPAYELRTTDAFTAGLLHDLGRIGLLKSYAKEYTPLMTAVYENPDQHLMAERWQFGMNHCLSGAFLARAWTFPTRLQEVAEQHHNEMDASDHSLIGLVKACCLLAAALGYPEITCREQPQRADIVRSLPPAVQTRISGRVAALTKRIADRLTCLEG